MNSLITIPLCILSWTFTLMRLKFIMRQGFKKTDPVTRCIWGMLLFFTITLTFLVVELSKLLDTYTWPDFSVLVYSSAFLVSQYFGIMGILMGMEIQATKKISQSLSLILGAELIALSAFYFFSFTKMPTIHPLLTQSFPQITLIAIASFFGIFMSIILVVVQLVYFPAEKFALLRLRTALIILCVLTSGIFLFSRVILFAAYFWPFLLIPNFVPLSYLSLVCSTLLFFCIFLSDRLYAQFLLATKSIESWKVFQDLWRLVEHLIPLCPVIGLPADHPGFWRFLLNPDYYLYRAIIIIMDSRAMLSDFLQESMQPGTPSIWENDSLEEAIRINDALQSANPSNDFAEIVETYHRISQNLFAGQKNTSTGVVL